MRNGKISGRICYFSVIHDSEEAKGVRFGFSEREEAQIITSIQDWPDLAARLRSDGCELVEARDGARDDIG